MVSFPETVLTSDPRVQRIPLNENNDPMVDVALHGNPGLEIDDRMAPLAGSERYLVRRTVVEKLQESVTLLPSGYRIGAVEGYRAPGVQRVVYAEYLESLKQRHPEWSEDEVQQTATRFASPPDLITPHSTGRAVDIVYSTLMVDKLMLVAMSTRPRKLVAEGVTPTPYSTSRVTRTGRCSLMPFVPWG